MGSRGAAKSYSCLLTCDLLSPFLTMDSFKHEVVMITWNISFSYASNECSVSEGENHFHVGKLCKFSGKFVLS